MLSEVHRIAAEVNCISGNVVSFVLNKGVKNSKQIITIVGNFQHTDHHFFGHNNREFVLVWLVKSGSYVMNQSPNPVLPRMLICLIMGLTDATLTCPYITPLGENERSEC